MSSRPAVTPGGPVGRFVVSMVMGVIRWLSPASRLALASFVGGLAWSLGIRRRVTLDNLAHAFPEKSQAERDRIARGAYRTMAIAALDAVTSDLLSPEELAHAVEAVDWKGLDRLLDGQHPVLIASAHLGSWELFAEVMARRGVPFSAVVRPLSGAFNEYVVRNREAAGVELILQRGALRHMLRALERKRPVVQLIDQALPSKQALRVPFFGRDASTTPAISMAAIASGAPVYLAVAVRDAGVLRVQVEGPFPVPARADREEAMREHTAQLTARLEGIIRAHPEQWLWLHRRWK
jgi:KDO2-lipid IV(A) lauroyltransferase